jgi:hypothetical protein
MVRTLSGPRLRRHTNLYVLLRLIRDIQVNTAQPELQTSAFGCFRLVVA